MRTRLVFAALTVLMGLLAVSQTASQASSNGGPAGRGGTADTHSPRTERMLPARAAPNKGAVLGIDVASQQHLAGQVIDWPKVAAAGYKFAFIKTTEGTYYANPYFTSDFRAAKAAGMLVAAYHFANPSYSSGRLQADFAVDHAGIGSDGVTLPLIADMEYDPYSSNKCYGLSVNQMVSWISAFTSEVYRLTGQDPVIYTLADWWNKCTGGSTAFAADPLWIASYAAGQSSPTMPTGWTTWTYWQYTSMGKVPGITRRTDISELNPAALQVAAPGTQIDPAGAAASLTIRSLTSKQPLAYSATGLPTGMTINPSTGVITGTPQAVPGSTPAQVTVSGPGLTPESVGFTWNLHGPVKLARPPNQAGLVGNPALVQVSATDSLPGCTLKFRASGLPPGLAIGQCGLISGWLSAPGTFHPVISVADSAGVLGSATFTWQVNRPRGAMLAGHIWQSADRKCLSPLANGIGLATCSHVASQRWTISPDGEMRIGGQCLAASDTGLVRLRACRDTVFQQWQAATNGGLLNQRTSDCLALARHARLVSLQTCDYFRTQQWELPTGPLASGIPGRCASAQLILRGCSRAAAWTALPDGTLRADHKCLTISFPAVAGAPVDLATCTGAAAQRWQIVNGPMAVQLVSPEAGLCLADNGDQGRGQLVLGYCLTTDPGISWRLS